MPRTSKTVAAYLIASVLGFACDAAPPVTQPAAPQPPATRPATAAAPRNAGFGVNLERLVSWSRSRVYIDATRTVFGFDTFAQPRDGKAPLGPDGLPAGDFGLLVIEDAAPSMGGTYKIVFPGTVREVRASRGAKITNQAYDADAGVTRADLTYNPAAANSLDLLFAGASLKGRLKVIRPGYTEADEPAKVFTDEFLAMLRAVSPGVIRGMDFLSTNNNAVVKWQDRPTRDAPLYSETAGGNRGAGPVEDLIDICNRVGADLWLNVPVAADADYRQQLAALVARQLNPDLYLYLEYGNENWNRSFSQHEMNLVAARLVRGADGYDSQDEIAGWQRTANETAKLGKVFRGAFDQVAPGQSARVRPVLCGQGANLATLQSGLQYLSGHIGKPSDLLYGIAVAPYAPLTPDLPLNDWRVRLLGGTHVTAFVNLAKSYNLSSCCYESGVDLSGTKLDPAAQKDPRMAAVMSAYWSAWKGTGPVLHYNVCNDTGPGKAWGLTDDACDLAQPKIAAAIKLAPPSPPSPPASPFPARSTNSP